MSVRFSYHVENGVRVQSLTGLTCLEAACHSLQGKQGTETLAVTGVGIGAGYKSGACVTAIDLLS